MKLLAYVKELLPRLSKNQIQEDLRITIAEVDQVVLPSYHQAAEFFRSNRFSSDENKDLSDDFYRELEKAGIAKQATFIGEVAIRLPYVRDNATYIQGLIESILERDVINEGLTVKKAILIRAAEHVSFVSRFSVDLLNLVYVNESIKHNTDVQETLRLSQGEINRVVKNIKQFSALISTYGVPNKDFVKILDDIPDVVISRRTEHSIVNLYKESDLDPIPSGLIKGFTGSPIYHVRLIIANWQANRYKANKEKKKVLELRALHLRLLNEKKNDPKIEQEIQYVQGRIDRLEQNLREDEESLAIEA